MTQTQWEYEAGYAEQAEAEYWAEMEYNAYLNKLIEDKQYRLHAVHLALDILNSKDFKNSGLSATDYFFAEKKRLDCKI